jgi:hypothetical protein
MAVTLTTSQTAAAASPATEPLVLIDFVTSSAEQHHVAAQPCVYEGTSYAARLVDVSNVQAAGAAVPYLLPAAKTLTVTIADDDGFFARQRPGWLRNQALTYREVFLDVNSAPVRRFDFITVNVEAPTEQGFVIQAEDILAPVRRKLFPSTDVLITNSLYPNLMRGTFQDGADGRNRPLPFVFGRARSPIYYVDQSSDGSYIYVAAVNSAYFTGSGDVFTWWDGGMSAVVTHATTPNNEGRSTFTRSIRYAVRNTTRDDGSSVSIPVTEIVIHPQVEAQDGTYSIVRRFADLTWNHGSSAWTTPDEVLIQMFGDCRAGLGISPTILNSDSLLTAHSFYTANSLYFDGAIIEQRPFEDWLAQWQHDAMTRLVMRDQIYLVPCASRAAVFSLHAGNILGGRATYTDVPLTQEYSRRTLFYKDRVADADYGPGVGGQGDNARGGSFVRWDVGSGVETNFVSPFIGRPSVARRVNQYWSEQQRAGQRAYQVPVTVKLIAQEEGDLGTLTHSRTGASSQLVEVAGITRRGSVYEFHVSETAMSVFSFRSGGADPDFGTNYQRVPYNAGSYELFTNTVFIVTGSHQMLGRTPTQVMLYGNISVLQGSLVAGATTNNSQFTIAHNLTLTMPGIGFNLLFNLQGWALYS